MYGVIYKIENTVNNKVYIGQTTKCNGFKGRYHGNVLKWTHNEHLKRAILKYGEEAFDIVEEFDVASSMEELNQKEEMWIARYNSNDYRYGYNETSGGGNYARSGYHKIKHAKSMCSKPILCTTTLEIFITVNDFSRKYGISKTSVCKTIKNRIPLHDKIFYVDDIQNILEVREYDVNDTYYTPLICLDTKDRLKNFNAITSYIGKKISPKRYFDTADKKGIKTVTICGLRFMKLYDYIIDETLKNNYIN